LAGEKITRGIAVAEHGMVGTEAPGAPPRAQRLQRVHLDNNLRRHSPALLPSQPPTDRPAGLPADVGLGAAHRVAN